MTKNLKIFLIAFIASLPLFLGINVIEERINDFFFWDEMASNPEILAAQVNQQILGQKLRELAPIKDLTTEDFVMESEAATSVFIDEEGQEKILFEKSRDKKLPIASLTKLMTVYVALKNYDTDLIVEIEKEAAEMPGNGEGKLKVGEKFRVKDLLYPILIESNNTAAYTLANLIDEENFLELMNLEAERFGLDDTYFVNPTGLDPEDSKDPINYSTARDLVELVKNLLGNELIWEINSIPEFDFYTPEGIYHHRIINTNELLLDPEWQDKIIGGKTGFTYEAGECFLLVVEAPKEKGYLINVILGSEDRFLEMKRLLRWIYRAYNW
ncbi:MAG: serine hydrolase [Candidatus Nealsonbacteria bacterium]